ncbi:MAG: hypothetical protein ISS10_04250 [Candidatus Marinimicrobia bacterium]|nr:hypothetical protein [Candidatus Neomarinimicrobiota bacterium]MBL7060194.1 hypothetical protein [Candidatus Neomarinimicrobiota bacterium]
MSADTIRLSGLQKAAVLFSVLGESLALTLVKGLTKTDIRKIRATTPDIKHIPFTVKKQVIEEFYFNFVSEKFQEKDDDEPTKPFEFLNNLTDEQLAALLSAEEPRVIAIVLAQVPPERRMVVMNRMDPEDKGKVLIQMGNLNDVPLEAVVNVANDLRRNSQFLPRTVKFSRGGGKEIAEILSSMDQYEEEKYLETLERENPELAKEVKKYHLTFDDIFEYFPENLLRDILNAIPDMDTVAMALKGFPEETVTKAIETLPQKKQAMFDPVEGAVPKRDVDSARKLILQKARELEKDGAFNLEDIIGGGEMVE